MTIYVVKTEKQTVKVPVMAGMEYALGTGRIINPKIREVGYDIIEFTYDVNPNCLSDKLQIAEKRIKRILFHK